MNNASNQCSPDRLLRLREVIHRLGLSKSHVYALIKQGAMPAPIKMGSVSAWIESEIDAFIGNAISASRATA